MPGEHSHYFDRQPRSHSRPRCVHHRFRGSEFRFVTDSGVFAKDSVDRGTRLLLESVAIRPGDRVLDLGCGYGVIGICLSAVVSDAVSILTDINRRAVLLARKNAERAGLVPRVVCADGLTPFASDSLDVVCCNPPIRAGKAVVEQFVRGSHRVLRQGGSLWMVVRTRQGAASLERMVRAAFGNVATVARAGGYRVFRAIK